MDFSTPLQFPYWAPADTIPAPLPTFNEIVSTGSIIRRSTVYPERCLALHHHGEHPGADLHKLNPVLSNSQRSGILSRLAGQVNELRQLGDTGYFGALSRRPFEASYLAGSGPFDSLNDFMDAFLDRRGFMVDERSPRPLVEGRNRFRASLIQALHGSERPVFTHGDNHTRNIMIRENGTPVLIDWEMSGWYPAFWEYFRMASLHLEQLTLLSSLLEARYPPVLQLLGDFHQTWDRLRNEHGNTNM
ncbi:Uu.00g051750.m01.CDS01 [Anthostomella pinea]|uniref:Uu.00g051750.m01.CDS01 n=1 Tax=Anthostomella pinea TaxID=933095 RepID=A0AAI8VWR1_9PEZI|nr:Uu.00g051750.m01.CDS01 [Anthostomella pinea]